MKKSIFLLLLITLSSWVSINNKYKTNAIEEASYCGPGYYPDEEYYNLFAQEVINAPQYTPFLLTHDSFYYSSKNETNLKNENIEDWKEYLDISYENAYYLVFKASRKSIQNLLKNNSSNDKNLVFANSQFIKKNKQSLLYLSYAKYLEPYMAVISKNEGYYWGNKPEHTVAELNYENVLTVLKKSWLAETDKELKLRYGYQMVRLAHYKLYFSDAISYFKDYVESLNYKGIMYYYALDQKGGAERGLGNFMQANYDFFHFFSNTKNFKEKAYNSMLVTQDLDFETLLKQVKTIDEKNDIYLILGRKEFNNPISSFEKIIEQSPNAVQAKVLMARAINQLERNILKLSYGCYYNCKEHDKSTRLPIISDTASNSFLKQTLNAAINQVENSKITDKAYWNLTTAYLYFIQKEYNTAKSYFNKVTTKTPSYLAQKDKLEMLLTISEQEKITSNFEESFFKEYKDYFISSNKYNYWDRNSTRNFVLDILANRYLLQDETAKSFLIQNNITTLENGIDMEILNAIEKLYFKKDKSSFENFIVENIAPQDYLPNITREKRLQIFDFPQYAAIMKGTYYLRNGEFKLAEKELKIKEPYTISNTNFDGYANIPNTIFGNNQIECFECPASTTIAVDYLEDFKFIPTLMDKYTLAQTLVKLEQLAKKRNNVSAKASYLIGNFFYNTSIYGYYRHILTYELDNNYNDKYRNFNSKLAMEISSKYYYKDYDQYAFYHDNFNLPLNYLNKAIETNKDDELTAKLLFTAAKCEQGQYYNISIDNDDIIALQKEYRNGNISYNEYNLVLDEYKKKNFKKYFKKLKDMNSTNFYDKVISNCLYFSSYVNN